MKKYLKWAGIALAAYLVIGWSYYFLYPGAREKIDAQHLAERKQDTLNMKADALKDSLKNIATLAAEMKKDLEKHKSAAYVMCREKAKQSLKYPEEADFDWAPKVSQYNDSALYHIIGSVVSKNGFGVKQRLYFEAYLKYLGGDDLTNDNWDFITFKMGEN